jgi:uncharacterized ferritin-like protein (DUF455 family)
MTGLAEACLDVLQTANARDKAARARKVGEAWRHGRLTRNKTGLNDWPDRPHRPEKPELLEPRNMPRRKISGTTGRKAQLHALAHIELNALDLAFDLVGRFVDAPLPDAFIDDWIKVGADEARHFLMLADRLADFDMQYGDLPAHDGLWQAAYDTRHDLMARLAVVPLVLEARGLDVTPTMMRKFEAANDKQSALMLAVIFEDEKTHVGAGSKWFTTLCNLQGVDPEQCFRDKVARYFAGQLKPPFNVEARAEAGLPEHFYNP